MHREWKELYVSEVAVSIYVAPGMGDAVHKNRPFHGLVLNTEGSVKDYVFSDGTVLHTEGCDLFYLPKGSSYTVEILQNGGCYAINFDAELSCPPFSVSLRNAAELTKSFSAAAERFSHLLHLHLLKYAAPLLSARAYTTAKSTNSAWKQILRLRCREAVRQ